MLWLKICVSVSTNTADLSHGLLYNIEGLSRLQMLKRHPATSHLSMWKHSLELLSAA